MTEDIPAEPTFLFDIASYSRPPKPPNLNSAQLLLLFLLLLSFYVFLSKSGVQVYEAIRGLSNIFG